MRALFLFFFLVGVARAEFSEFGACDRHCLRTRTFSCPTGQSCTQEPSFDQLVEPCAGEYCPNPVQFSYYVWHTTPWSSCGAQHTRAVTCRDRVSATKLYSDELCLAYLGARPATTKTCVVSAQWSTTWSACKPGCWRVQEFRCVNNQEIFDDSVCPGPRPDLVPVSEPCPSSECPVSRSNNYRWDIGEWSACDPSDCSQTRSLVCLGTVLESLTEYPSEYCAWATGETPVTSQRCASCTAMPAVWSSGSWSSCDSHCSQRLLPRCVDLLTQQVPIEDSKCPVFVPQARTCSQCPHHEWHTSWSGCDAQCQRSQAVSCWDLDANRAVSDVWCLSLGDKPSPLINEPCYGCESNPPGPSPQASSTASMQLLAQQLTNHTFVPGVSVDSVVDSRGIANTSIGLYTLIACCSVIIVSCLFLVLRRCMTERIAPIPAKKTIDLSSMQTDDIDPDLLHSITTTSSEE